VVDPLVDQLPELIAGERLHLVRGRMAFDAKRFQDAAAEFRKAISQKPESIPAHLNLANSLVQMNDLPAAATEFETVLHIDPNNVNARFNLAILYAKANQHQQAIEHLRSLLKVNPSDSGAHLFLAQELLKSEQRSEALREFALVSRADPDNEDALLQEVMLLQEQQQYQSALERLIETYAQHPARTQTGAMLAYLLAASPQYNLRNGERALQLAHKVFKETGLVQHGALVTSALAELGRCSEAADWQRRMIGLAEQQHQAELAKKFQASLKLYEGAASCRPTGQAR
jgi:tetratricopeptide (TPR) repeat protein